MKYLAVFILFPGIFLSAVSCTNEDSKQKHIAADSEKTDSIVSNRYHIRGTVYGADSGWVYLMYEDTTNTTQPVFRGRRDSAKIINGAFSFSGEIDAPQKVMAGGRVGRGNGTFSFLPVIERGGSSITIIKDSLWDTFKAYGTAAQDEYNLYTAGHNKLIAESNKIYIERKRLKKNSSQRVQDSLDEASAAVQQEMDAYVQQFVKKHPSSPVAAFVANEHLKSHTNANPAAVYNLFAGEIKNSYYGRQVAAKAAAAARTATGTIAPMFAIPDKNGRSASLQSLLTEYTLVDFWASWCAPCRAENPHLLKAYGRFKDKGFSIVSVSLDNNRPAWLKAMQEDKLPWIQLSDLKGSGSPVKELYGITSIPRNFLLDRQGKIVATDLRGPQLEKKLQELL